jgi:HK97 family phage prohead protease
MMNENKDKLEIRAVSFEATDDMVLEGYAIVFDTRSSTLYQGNFSFQEVIENRSLDNVETDDVYLLYNHNYENVLGSTKSGTLGFTVTEKGLYFRSTLPDTEKGKEIYSLVKRGDLNQMSFGFTVKSDSWDTTTEPYLRKVEEIGSLDEISIVPRPAYPQTNVNLRTIEEIETQKQECLECKAKLQEAKALLEEVSKSK